jgi:hypothetical protein
MRGLSNASEAVKKLAESSKTQNAPVGNQRFAQANFGRFQFFHSFSVTAGVEPCLFPRGGFSKKK